MATRDQKDHPTGKDKEKIAGRAEKLAAIKDAVLRHGVDTHEAITLVTEIDTIVWGS